MATLGYCATKQKVAKVPFYVTRPSYDNTYLIHQILYIIILYIIYCVPNEIIAMNMSLVFMYIICQAIADAHSIIASNCCRTGCLTAWYFSTGNCPLFIKSIPMHLTQIVQCAASSNYLESKAILVSLPFKKHLYLPIVHLTSPHQ